MRRLLLLTLLALPLWGQTPPTTTNLECRPTDRSAVIKWQTSVTSGDACRIAYDYDNATLDRRSRQNNSTSANGGRRSIHLFDLNPDDDVYFGDLCSEATKVVYSNPLCTANCTNCTSADQSIFTATGSGCDCTIGEHPRFHTAVEDLDTSIDPPVSGALTTPPTITGSTFAVDPGCTNFDEQKLAAENDADTGLVSLLTLPAGEPCALDGSSFNLTPVTNGGMVVVTSDADPKLLPPAGTQLDKTSLPFLGIITYKTMGAWGYNDELITVSNLARGYYFYNIALVPPALDSSTLTPLTLTITGIDTSDGGATPNTITVTSTAGLSTGNAAEVVYVNLDGTGVRGAYGPLQTCNVTATTLQLTYNVTNKSGCGTKVDLTGTYGSGGTVRRFIALPIEAHGAAGSGNHEVTITGHGLANYPDATVTDSPAANQLTISGLASLFQIGTLADGNSPNAKIVHVEGTGACDGLFSVSTIAGAVNSTLTLVRTGVTIDCAGATEGTVHGHRAYSNIQTSSDAIGDYEPRSFNVEATDANTLEYLETTAVAGVTGGYLFGDVEQLGTIIRLTPPGGGTTHAATGVSDVTFDRVLLDNCLPWHNFGAINITTTRDVAIVNSFLKTCAWRRLNPVNSVKERIHGISSSHLTITGTDSQGLIVRNNFMTPSPQIFMDDSNSGTLTEDIATNDLEISANTLWYPDWVATAITGVGATRYHHLELGFPMEFKSMGARTAIFGNWFKGWSSNFQATEPAIEFSVNGSANGSFTCNGPSHARVEYNIFDRGGTVFAMTRTHGDMGPSKIYCPTEKLSFSYNLIRGIDTNRYNNNGSGGTGAMLVFGTGFRDFMVTRNTDLPERVAAAHIVRMNERASGFRLTDNILGFTEGNGSVNIGILQDVPGSLLPAKTEDGGYAAFQQWLIRGTTFDSGTSEISGNIGIPMLKSSTSGTYSVKIASLSASDAHCVDSVSALDKVLDIPMTWIGTTGACPATLPETVADRLNTVFESGTYTPKAAYSTKGAPVATIADQHGMVGAINVTADDNEATIAFHAPTAAACPVDVAPCASGNCYANWMATWDDEATITRTPDPAPDQEQVASFTGLTPETQYGYKINCAKQARGVFTTAGAP